MSEAGDCSGWRGDGIRLIPVIELFFFRYKTRSDVISVLDLKIVMVNILRMENDSCFYTCHYAPIAWPWGLGSVHSLMLQYLVSHYPVDPYLIDLLFYLRTRQSMKIAAFSFGCHRHARAFIFGLALNFSLPPAITLPFSRQNMWFSR